jgi:periplasmic copper chaperone A
MRYFTAALIIALGVFVLAHAASPEAGSVTVEHAWARATPKGAPNAAVYLTLVNNGSETDRLIGASSPVADNIQFHEERDENGVSKMLALQAIDVAPGASVALKPSGIHLMLRIKQPLKQGETFSLTLTFEKAGPIEATVRVGKVGAMDDMEGM